jgi:hypothetical protein
MFFNYLACLTLPQNQRDTLTARIRRQVLYPAELRAHSKDAGARKSDSAKDDPGRRTISVSHPDECTVKRGVEAQTIHDVKDVVAWLRLAQEFEATPVRRAIIPPARSSRGLGMFNLIPWCAGSSK